MSALGEIGLSPIGVGCQFLTFLNSVYTKLHHPPIYTYCLKAISTYFPSRRRPSVDDTFTHSTLRTASKSKVAGHDSGAIKR